MRSASEPESLPVAEARAGDSLAWDRLLRRYQRPLFAFAHELVRDEQAALDIVQETFIRAVRHLGTLREDARFGSWIFGIAHQLCARRARRAWREEPVRDPLDGAPDESFPAPDEWLVRDEDATAVFALLAELPEAQRASFTLHVLEDFSLAEIAEITGVPEGTVKSRLHHARRTLRERIELRGKENHRI